MQDLRQQVYKTLQRSLPQGTSISMKSTAIDCRLPTGYGGAFVEVDVVLAPYLAAAGQRNGSTDNRAVLQRKAILRPLLSAADDAAAGADFDDIALPEASYHMIHMLAAYGCRRQQHSMSGMRQPAQLARAVYQAG